jgi:hypothetical protein
MGMHLYALFASPGELYAPFASAWRPADVKWRHILEVAC